jgi:hypothetical protein
MAAGSSTTTLGLGSGNGLRDEGVRVRVYKVGDKPLRLRQACGGRGDDNLRPEGIKE